MQRLRVFPYGWQLRLWLLLLPLLSCYRAQAQTPVLSGNATASHYYLSSFEAKYPTHPVSLLPGRLSPVTRGTVLAVAAAGIWTATFALADEPLQQYTQSHRTPFADKSASVVRPLGDQKFMAPLAGAAFAGGLLLKDSKLEKVGLVSLGSIVVSSGVTGVLKNQFHRHRPSSTTENHIFDGSIHEADNTSLPSAHTATAFAVATTVAKVYGHEYRFVPPIAYGVASLVGLSRINDNAHWATDVLAGAAVGYFSARCTLYLYDLAEHKSKLHRQRLLIAPKPDLHALGLHATLVF